MQYNNSHQEPIEDINSNQINQNINNNQNDFNHKPENFDNSNFYEDLDLNQNSLMPPNYLFASENLDEIHKKTYISVFSLNKIARKEFKSLDRVHFQGFIKILAKHYPNYDWQSLFEDYIKDSTSASFEKLNQKIKQFKEEKKVETPTENNQNFDFTPHQNRKTEPTTPNFNNEEENQNLDFITSDSTNKSKTKILAFAILLMMGFSIFIMTYSDGESSENTTETANVESNLSPIFYSDMPKEEQENIEKLANDKIDIQESFKNIKTNIEEKNNKAIEDAIQDEVNQKVIVKAKNRVWLGRIYLDDFSKHSEIIPENGTFDFIPDTNQLLVFGHGNIIIEYGGNFVDLDTPDKKRFLIKNSQIKEITKKEFIELNRGRVW